MTNIVTLLHIHSGRGLDRHRGRRGRAFTDAMLYACFHGCVHECVHPILNLMSICVSVCSCNAIKNVLLLCKAEQLWPPTLLQMFDDHKLLLKKSISALPRYTLDMCLVFDYSFLKEKEDACFKIHIRPALVKILQAGFNMALFRAVKSKLIFCIIGMDEARATQAVLNHHIRLQLDSR
jgi:hypothetical protein